MELGHDSEEKGRKSKTGRGKGWTLHLLDKWDLLQRKQREFIKIYLLR